MYISLERVLVAEQEGLEMKVLECSCTLCLILAQRKLLL